MNNIQETLFRAIETITDSKLNQIKFDRTIQGIIVSDDKADAGEYSVKYQDLIFTAYASTRTTKYKKDENVLILVPDGDMSNRKTIVSSNKKEGDSYIDVDNVIDRVGINFIDEANDYEIGLSTTTDEVVAFKVKKQKLIDMYPGKKYLSIGADVYTNINTEDIEGTYGIALDCMFVNNEGEKIPHTFEFNTLNVTGNPFQARGYKETQIPLLEERLVEIVGARAFSKGFTKGYEKIRLRNISIEYVSIREQDKSDYSGNIITPRGTHFRNSSLYPDDSLDLVMEFKQKGDVLKTEAVDYKWFILNSAIDSIENPSYHPDAGLGWEWIKSTDYEDSLLKGANTSTLSVFSGFVPTFSTFKCIAYYSDAGVSVSDMVTLVDHTDEMKTEIQSSNGVGFVNGLGETNLTCYITQGGKPIDGLDLEYRWSQIKANEEVSLIQTGDKNTVKIKASSIGAKSTYTCEVILKKAKRPVSTGFITLVNVIDGTTQGATIVGGFRTVLYDGEGRPPEGLVKEGFQFDVYSNGNKITSNINWTWKIPSSDKTLLTMENPVIDREGKQTSKDKVLNLGVSKQFDFKKSQNFIELEVEYTENGVVNILRDFATIAITKVGQNGADGAAGQAGADGKTYVYQIEGGTQTITYDQKGTRPQPNPIKPFVLMFSVDGDTGLAKDVDYVNWQIQSKSESVLSFQGKDKSVRSITTRKTPDEGSTNPHIISLVADETYDSSKYNNYISAEIYYQGRVYRETYPISVIKNGTDGEVGLTITTNPSSYSLESEADGNVKDDVSLMLNFDIYRSDTKIEDFRIISVGGVPRGMSHEVKGNVLKLTFLKGRELPDNGVIEINLSVEGKPCKQSFTFSKTRDGESPYLLILQSTNGLVFKRGDISTVIYAIVMRGSSIVTDKIPEEAFEWEKIDKNGKVVRDWSPKYMDNQRDKIVVTPEDILERATFNCSLNL